MAEYSITLPDGTCIEGDAPHYVLQMATVMRDGYEDEADEDDSGFTVPYGGHEITLSGDEADDDDGITVEYSGSRTYDGDESKKLQERVDEAFADG